MPLRRVTTRVEDAAAHPMTSRTAQNGNGQPTPTNNNATGRTAARTVTDGYGQPRPDTYAATGPLWKRRRAVLVALFLSEWSYTAAEIDAELAKVGPPPARSTRNDAILMAEGTAARIRSDALAVTLEARAAARIAKWF